MRTSCKHCAPLTASAEAAWADQRGLPELRDRTVQITKCHLSPRVQAFGGQPGDVGDARPVAATRREEAGLYSQSLRRSSQYRPPARTMMTMELVMKPEWRPNPG
jgi:hypothetical protein